MAIIPDTLSGALVLSVFDFIACFCVLWGISFVIRGVSFVSNKFPDSTEDNKKSSH